MVPPINSTSCFEIASPNPSRHTGGWSRHPLRKLLKELGDVPLGNADAGVLDREPQAGCGALQRLTRHRQPHLPAVRKLDRVAHQVGQHLTDAARIANDPTGGIRGVLDDEDETFGLGLDPEQGPHLGDGCVDIEGERFDEDFAGFDLWRSPGYR